MLDIRKFYTPLIIILIISSIFAVDLARRNLAGEFDQDKIKLDVLYSSEKAGWLESVVEIFEEEYNKENTGPPLDVVMTPIGTGKGTIQVASAASKPTIWSPASRFWLPILNLLWERNNEGQIVDPNSPSGVISPTIIATWKSYQQQKQIDGLQDLHDLAVEDPQFTFAHTDPYSSNSGFGGVIMESAVAANKVPEALTLEDLSNETVQQWMRELESSAVQYGSSTGFLAKLMVNEGPSQLKAALLYENLVVEKNKELKNKIKQGQIPANQTLTAIYPEEGTLLNDHPFTVLDAPWVNQQDKDLANQFIDFLLTRDIQEQAIEFGFRPAIDIESDLIQETFSSSAGVKQSLENVTIYEISEMDGEVLERIPDLWSATRSRSIDEQNQTELTASDYIFPAIIVGMFLIMILTPVYKRYGRELL